MNNSLKYAQASLLSVELKKDGAQKYLIYHDNGQGVDLAMQRKGLGLKNLDSRTRLISGLLEVETAPGQGFTATVQF